MNDHTSSASFGFRKPAIAFGLAIWALAVPAMAQESNKDFVVKAMTELLINQDITAVDRYWAEDYIQHNPAIKSGSAEVRAAFAQPPAGFKYEIGMVIAEGDLVVLHGRYTGFGPKPFVAVDIFRVEDGKIAEHWDVLQEEVAETASGNPMFTPMQ
jgi:predicted SnoaL-like aldol condensation-catalyzing enzyme